MWLNRLHTVVVRTVCASASITPCSAYLPHGGPVDRQRRNISGPVIAMSHDSLNRRHWHTVYLIWGVTSWCDGWYIILRTIRTNGQCYLIWERNTRIMRNRLSIKILFERMICDKRRIDVTPKPRLALDFLSNIRRKAGKEYKVWVLCHKKVNDKR